MINKTKHPGKKHFYRYFLHCFSGTKVLECHVKNSLAINHTKSVFLPGEGSCVNCQCFKRLSKAPFMIIMILNDY